MTITETIIYLIFDFILWIVYNILFLIFKIISLISYQIPDQITEALTWLFSLTHYAAGIFNLNELFLALGLYINFLILWYTFKVIMWAYAHLPWIGKGHTKLPEEK